MNACRVTIAIALTACSAAAQLPASGALSASDEPFFRAEIARIEKLLLDAPDPGSVIYLMARTLAYARQWPETIDWLRKTAALNVGLDPSRDSIFGDIKGTAEFQSIVSDGVARTPTVSHSKRAFQVKEGDLTPESMAFDPGGKHSFFGSMKKGKVLQCSGSGACTDFADGLGEVLGIKVARDGLWVLSNAGEESSLIHFDLISRRVIRRYSVTGGGHEFNDLAFGPAGDVYVSDTRGNAVWRLSKGAGELTRLAGRFDFANGITVSPDGSLLYVSVFPDGITVVDLKTNSAAAMRHPANVCLATIDGLYFYGKTLLAIQNGFMTPRVARFALTADLRGVQGVEVLERRNPEFEGITTGVIAGRNFFYMANIQDDRKSDFRPISILRLPL